LNFITSSHFTDGDSLHQILPKRLPWVHKGNDAADDDAK
jgi:hypothetical protein